MRRDEAEGGKAGGRRVAGSSALSTAPTAGDESFHSSVKLLGNSFERHDQPLYFLPSLILPAAVDASAVARETFPDSSKV